MTQYSIKISPEDKKWHKLVSAACISTIIVTVSKNDFDWRRAPQKTRYLHILFQVKSSYLINLHYGFLNTNNVSAGIVCSRGPGPGNYVTSPPPPDSGARPGQTKYFIIHTRGQTILNFNVNAETIVLSWHNAAGLDWLSTFNSFVEFITFYSGTNYDNNEQNSYGACVV